MAENNFKGTVEALFHGMDGVVSSKTVVGEAIHIGDTIILPLVDVSFAVGAGAFNADKKEKRCRRYRWEDDTKCGAGHSEWSHQACEHQESGYDHEAVGYGTGCDGSFLHPEKKITLRKRM